MLYCKLLAERIETCHILFHQLIHLLLEHQPFSMQFLVTGLLSGSNIRHIGIDLSVNKNNIGTEFVHEIDHIIIRLALRLNELVFQGLQLFVDFLAQLYHRCF